MSGKLFAFHYDNEAFNELDRLLELWNDVSYLHHFVKENISDIPKNKDIDNLIIQIIDDANEIDETLSEIESEHNLDRFFKPLNNQEYRSLELSKQKGRNNYLRIYAIKIDTNCFVITGGAIKFTHLMEDRDHTANELEKIKLCGNYLKENSVFDIESFLNF